EPLSSRRWISSRIAESRNPIPFPGPAQNREELVPRAATRSAADVPPPPPRPRTEASPSSYRTSLLRCPRRPPFDLPARGHRRAPRRRRSWPEPEQEQQLIPLPSPKPLAVSPA
uniref:Uncharacterized protein n=1 Tax=Aegilops tauschii subsp. strangulata TaxID=200361 RepID=A0A453NBC2_AEGTS